MTVNPTVVIGVGEAGCKMARDLYDDLERMHQGDTEAFLDQFLFIGIDTREEDLEDHTRDNFRNFGLDTPTEVFETAQLAYGYLSDDLDLEPAGGATRQRRVSRFYIDNEKNFDTLYGQLESAITEFIDRDRPATAEVESNPNLWLVNSFGGGTGSGAFPLLTAMLQEITPDDVWIGGIGSLPRVDQLDEKQRPPDDDPNLYANAYAALRELSVLLDYEFSMADDGSFDYRNAAGENFPIRIPVLSEPNMNPEGEYLLEEPPFDFYGLLGLNEGKKDTKSGYLEDINRIAANTVLYFSEATGLEDFGSGLPADGNERLFSLDSAGVEVPLDDLDAYTDELRALTEIEQDLSEVHRQINHTRYNRDILRYVTDLTDQDPGPDPTAALSTTFVDPETGEDVEIDALSVDMDESDESDESDEDDDTELFDDAEEADEDDETQTRDLGVEIESTWQTLLDINSTARQHARDFPLAEFGSEMLEQRVAVLLDNTVEFSDAVEFDAEDLALYFYYVELALRLREERSGHRFRTEMDEEWTDRQEGIRNRMTLDPEEYENDPPTTQWEEVIDEYYGHWIAHLEQKIDDLPFYKRSLKKETQEKLDQVERRRNELDRLYTEYVGLEEALDAVTPKMKNSRQTVIGRYRELEDRLNNDLGPERQRHREAASQYENSLEEKQAILSTEGTGRFRTIPFEDFEEVSGGILDDASDIMDLVGRGVIDRSTLVEVAEHVLADELDERIQDLEPYPVGAGIANDYLGGMANETNRDILRGELDDSVPEASVTDAMTFNAEDLVDLADPYSIRLVTFYKNVRLENTSEFGTFHRLYRSNSQISTQFGIDQDDDDFATARFAYPEFFPDDDAITSYYGDWPAAIQGD